MPTPTHIHSTHATMDNDRHSAPTNPGLWKLLVAAAAILISLFVAIEVFGDGADEGFVEGTPQAAEK